MLNEVNTLYQEYFDLISRFHFHVEEEDYQVLETHLSLLQKLDVVETSIISVFDLYQRKHVYVSRQFESLFGWNLDEAGKEISSRYTDSFYHPQDHIDMLRSGNYYLSLVFGLPTEVRKNYKLIRDYRMLNHEGKYVRVVEQMVGLELDRAGNPWLSLSLLDFSPDNDITIPFRSRAIDLSTGMVYHFQPEEEKNVSKSPLSTRETEILSLISDGLVSKQIADKLFISVNTVNTHRQRIIEKLNVSNTAEAIKYATGLGLI